MSPAAPMPQRRGRPALEGNEEWVAGVLEGRPRGPEEAAPHQPQADLRQARRRARLRRLVLHRAEVRPRVQACPGGGGRERGTSELEWAPGTCQVDFGNFRAAVGGRTLDLKLLVAYASALETTGSASPSCRRGRSACAPGCSRSSAAGAAPRRRWCSTTPPRRAGWCAGRSRKSRLFLAVQAHYRFESRYCNPIRETRRLRRERRGVPPAQPPRPRAGVRLEVGVPRLPAEVGAELWSSVWIQSRTLRPSP